jgi:glucokinase
VAKRKRTIGIDLGGTNISFVDLFSQNNVLGRLTISTPDTKKGIVDALRKNVLFLAAQSPGDIYGVGIAVAGQVSAGKNSLVFSPNLPFKKEYPLGKELEETTGLRVTLENDANAAAIGEKVFGAAVGMEDFAVITLGTGIGSGIFANGSLLRGFVGAAGEAGHIRLAPDGPLCGCGQKGCLEALASGTAISAAYRKKTGEKRSAKEICELARKGEKSAVAVLGEAGEWLGTGLVTIVNLFNPQGIFFTGSLINAPKCYFEPALRILRKTSFGSSARKLKVGISKLGAEAGTIGAASLPHLRSRK